MGGTGGLPSSPAGGSFDTPNPSTFGRTSIKGSFDRKAPGGIGGLQGLASGMIPGKTSLKGSPDRGGMGEGFLKKGFNFGPDKNNS